MECTIPICSRSKGLDAPTHLQILPLSFLVRQSMVISKFLLSSQMERTAPSSNSIGLDASRLLMGRYYHYLTELQLSIGQAKFSFLIRSLSSMEMDCTTPITTTNYGLDTRTSVHIPTRFLQTDCPSLLWIFKAASHWTVNNFKWNVSLQLARPQLRSQSQIQILTQS